jgi:hypothetical protein
MMSAKQGFRGIPGVPDGWELLAIRRGCYGEWHINADGKPMRVSRDTVNLLCIIRKIEVPKKYRAFANGEEFKTHRDRWWRYAVGEGYLPQINPPIPYNELGVDGATWQQAFNGRVFDDGTPFGVEVTE